MFEITPTKTFMDSVHGYINIPRCFVDNIINTEWFQRLRNIDQTGMRILYPNAKHDRFGHSLGVYHLGSKAVDALLCNFSDDIYWKISSDNKKALFWAKNKVLFLLACLLHDIGHVPFSHALEGIVLSNSSDGKKRFTDIFCEKFNATENWDEIIQDAGNVAPHELLGAMLILDTLKENIEKVYNELIIMGYPQEKREIVLYAEHYKEHGIIDKSEFDKDICFIIRMITGLKYRGYEPEKQIRNCFIELLNGSNFDVDKLDYIVRDTQMSGISNINIDIERLLKSVCIVLKTRCMDQNFEDRNCSNYMIHKLDNRSNSENEFQIKGFFNGTLIIEPEAQVSIAKDSTFISMHGSDEDSKIRYVDDHAEFSESSKIYRDGRPIGVRNNKVKLSDTDNNIPFELSIQSAQVISDKGFVFIVQNRAIILKINGYCNITIKGKWRAEASVSFFDDTYIKGKVHEIVFMGNVLYDKIPTEKEYTTFSVGFKKQALNIIANVLEARDYLYLWVYAHHKVIYYANFLIPVLSNVLLSSEEKTNESGFPTWNLTYKDIEHLDDAYIWTVIKYCRDKYSYPIDELCTEVLSRNYKTSMFKSLAEFELLFEAFSDNKRSAFRRHLLDNIDNDKPCVMNEDGNITAGYLNKEFIEKLKTFGNISNLKNIIYVDANYKQKNINMHETYITMQEESISVNKIPLLANRNVLSNKASTQYFYLYYETFESVVGDIDNQEMKSSIRKYLKEMVI